MAQNGDTQGPWFPEPEEEDDTYKHRLEGTPSWLARSTVDTAKDYRDFLNRNLNELPEKCQRDMYRNLRNEPDHRSGLFELIVARMLQTLGASLTCEPENPIDGTKIDFMARFPDGTVGIEATSPVFDKEMGETARSNEPLKETIEKMTPKGWAVAINGLPALNPSDSKKQFKSAVGEMLDVELPEDGASERKVERELPQGEIRLTLFPKNTFGLSERTKLLWESALTTIDNSKVDIRGGVKAKRRQARNVTEPVLVAVDGKGIVTRLEDFDMALFGHTRAYINQSGDTYDTKFIADGLFAGGEGEPTIAGVLAFTKAGVLGCDDPVLYIHPRFSGELPQALLRLERRKLDFENGAILVEESQNPGFMEAMGFIDF